MTELQRFFITDRLLLRPWEGTDAESLYDCASDEELARNAGFAPHISVAYSIGVIDNILSRPGTYAVVPRDVRKAIGSIGLKFGNDGNVCLDDDEAEIGYWIGNDFRGHGYIPEAVRALLRYAFSELKLNRVWCLCREDNHNSRRVQEKCGFSFIRNGVVNDPLYGQLDMRFTCITKEEWNKSNLLNN